MNLNLRIINMKCYYHKIDFDGFCSAAIVNKRHPGIEMIPVNYPDKPNFSTIEEGELIFIVDFSFEREDMILLNEIADIHWIDHHASALKKCEGLDIRGIQKVGKAGCELTWEYIYDEDLMPLAVKLLGRYDVWDHTGTITVPFQFGMRNLPEFRDPTFKGWSGLLKWNNIKPLWIDFIEDTIKTGNIIIKYQESQDEIYAKGMSFECEFEGLRAICINKAYANSSVFKSVYDPSKHDIMLLFEVKQGKNGVKISLYSDKEEVDCSELASQRGGGGHKGAAGFTRNNLIHDFQENFCF